jgi:hypothetical protein
MDSIVHSFGLSAIQCEGLISVFTARVSSVLDHATISGRTNLNLTEERARPRTGTPLHHFGSRARNSTSLLKVQDFCVRSGMGSPHLAASQIRRNLVLVTHRNRVVG